MPYHLRIPMDWDGSVPEGFEQIVVYITTHTWHKSQCGYMHTHTHTL